MAKKYTKLFWIKLSDDFLFSDIKIKKLRKLAGGDTFTIVYLKMMLVSKNNNGIIEYEGIEKTFEEEIALKIDEDPENVTIIVNFLKNVGLIEEQFEGKEPLSYYFPQVETMIGSESESAERTRKYRDRLKKKALESKGTQLLPENFELSISSQCDENVTKCDKNVTLEKEIDKDKDKDVEIEKNTTENSTFELINLDTIVDQFQTTRNPTNLEIQTLLELSKKYSYEEVYKSVKIAQKRNKLTTFYIKGILNNARAVNNNLNPSSIKNIISNIT